MHERSKPDLRLIRFWCLAFVADQLTRLACTIISFNGFHAKHLPGCISLVIYALSSSAMIVDWTEPDKAGDLPIASGLPLQ